MRVIRSLSRRYVSTFGKTGIYKRSGLNLLLDPRNHVDFRIAARLPFESAQIQRAKDLIVKERLTTVLDIGANIGLYAVALGVLPQVQNVYAFEPVRANFNQLSANVFLNGLNAKITTYRLALGREAGTADIYVEPASTGRSRLEPSYSGDAEAFTHKEQVDVRKLDDLVPLTGQRLFIKIDVEGHAVDVLQGMTKLLACNTAFIQAELLEYDREAIIRCLADSGYSVFDQVDVDGYFSRAAA